MSTMNTVKRFTFLGFIALLTILGPFFFGYHFNTLREASLEFLNDPSSTLHLSSASKNFHLLLPATDPNNNFCKLLLSAAITGYPEPIFLGWKGHGIFNGTESHLFKITETLAYLRSLPKSQDGDMVLVLDAYDIWLQLPPSVLFSRYESVIAKNDKRLKREGVFGKEWGGAGVKSSIVFGPDKIHWPQHSVDPAVWAVPESPMDEFAFGPETDTDMFTARPRWLNSGTIMGPAKDMRDMFAATVDMLSRRFDSEFEFRTSDQYYFAEVWGEQETNRLRLLQGENFTVPEGHRLPATGWSKKGSETRTEFGMCLDYETELFQTAAAYDRHLAWMRFNGTTAASVFEEKLREEAGLELKGKSIDRWTLPSDMAKLDTPFAAAQNSLSDNRGWEDVMLGTNVVTQHVFPLFHVTGDKSLRDRWWPRMWFHPHSETLLKAVKKKQANQEDPTVFLTQDGVRWRSVRPGGEESASNIEGNEKGGAWTDGGDYVSWEAMCGKFEDELFVTNAKDDL